jgi:radical SAM protein with 4Fe4S-binding SPASM domain
MKSKYIRIELTRYCNRKCPYCFFIEKLTDARSEMDISEFNRILDFCDADAVPGQKRNIYLQGGEPTTHSRFTDIISILNKRNYPYALVTNGIFDTSIVSRLGRGPQDDILLNYNHPDTYNSINDWELVNRNIEELSRKNIKFTLGYNMYEENPDYGFFIKAIEKYNIKAVRWDLTRPSGEFANRHFKLEEFFTMKPVVIKFIKDYMATGQSFGYDCPLPMCMLLDRDFNFANYKIDLTCHADCGALLNVGAGLEVATCPASIGFQGIKLTDFRNVEQAARFVGGEVDELRWSEWALEDCEGCVYRYLRECQGGCIGHKRVKRNKVSGRKELEDFLRREAEGINIGSSARPPETEAYRRGIEKYEKAIAEGKGYVTYQYYSLGRCYEALEEYDSAIAAYEKAYQLDKEHIISLNRLNLSFQLKSIKNNPLNEESWTRLQDALKRVLSVENGADLVKYYRSRYLPAGKEKAVRGLNAV